MPPRKKPAPRRIVQAAAAETVTPPDALSETQAIARITGAIGNNIYTADLPSRKSLKVELATKFRSTIYMLRGTFVLIDTQEHAELDTRLDGKIINIVREDRTWRKMGYWYVYTMLKIAGICKDANVQRY